MTATRAIEAEEQLPICYGDLNNSILYLKDGLHFWQTDNLNVTEINLWLNDWVSHHEEKSKMVNFVHWKFDACR